ncbi:hypothetical protein BX070DRAFT_206217 [Coemansia spiralis]|nr:hypothetical protein BX070DRAFT_206217 [Coemansia spiralis]
MQYMNYLARRVLALPLGRSLLRYSTCDLNSQDSLSVTNPRVAARFRGNKVETVWAAGDSDMHWPLFHSGVAAALSIERDQLRQAHSSWVLLHWPSETGIIGTDSNSIFFAGKKPPSNGPLCDVPPWQVFKYLSIRHGLTSIALLLGYACAHRGSMSGSVSKILSLHIPNLLPPGSSELMLLSYGIQAAAMLGLGLLFMKSQNRRMAEVMLHELSSMKWATPDNTSSRLDDTDPAEGTAECYSLASGFALGFVALGQGLATRTLADLRLLDALSELLSGATTNIGNMIRYSSQPAESAALNSNSAGEHSAYYGSMPTMFSQLSTAPASGGKLSDLGVIAAIGLVFLGTNYMPAAQRLALPASFNQLKVADPFIVLWKTLMRSLIMLDHISTTKEWVESNMPCHSNTVHEPHSKELQRMRMHVVSAACFSIALKFAGTEDQAAHSTILAYFDELESIVARPALGYESNLTRSSAQLCLDIICISAALVMAGSGDIETMKRLRALHSVSASRTYGNHMASHMALGVLFLGGGARFTISRSLDTMALLVVSFFPRFPQHYSDNREHLQAWRHLWSLCVEPRCLIVRDTTTGIMCENVTATVFKSGPDGTINSELAILPLPLLALKGAQSMRLQALGYIPLTIDLDSNSAVPDLLLRRCVLYMQPQNQAARTSVILSLNAKSLQQQYQHWLDRIQLQVTTLISHLERASSNVLLAEPEVIVETLSAIERLRVCVRLSGCPLFADMTNAISSNINESEARDSSWAEATYLAWLAVRSAVLALGRTEASRRMLTIYWTSSQLLTSGPLEKQSLYILIGLLYVTLDLPSAPDARELSKHVPMSSLIDYMLAFS